MKEKKVKVSNENWDYLVDKLQYILADYLHEGESDEVIAEFVNLLEIDNLEEKKLNFLPFNLEAAKAGKPVCTRDGRKARIICFDAEGEHPIIALVTDGVQESPYNYSKEGYYHTEGIETMVDLMMASEKKTGWINIMDNEDPHVYCAYIYPTQREAVADVMDVKGYIATIQIEWEE